MESNRNGISTHSCAGCRCLRSSIKLFGILRSVLNYVRTYFIAGFRYLGTRISCINRYCILESIRNSGSKALDTIRHKSVWEVLYFFHTGACMVLDYYAGTVFRRVIDITLLSSAFFQTQNFTPHPSSFPEENHPEKEPDMDS